MREQVTSVSLEQQVCVDCVEQAEQSCRLCDRPFCQTHVYNVLGYNEHGMVRMCYGCSQAFACYVQAVVNPRYYAD